MTKVAASKERVKHSTIFFVCEQGLLLRVCNKKKSYFSTKTYVVGTQKNHLNEMVLLSTQNMLKIMGKKIFTFVC